MGLFLEIVSAQGIASRIALQPGPQRITPAIGDRYRIIDGDTGRTPPGIVVKRLDNHLLVDGLPDGVQLEIGEFYARCGVSSPCTLVIEPPGEHGGAPVDISPSSPPLQALTDGSFVLYPSGHQGGQASTAADGEPAWGGNATWVIVGVAAAVAAGAAGGGGGDGASSPVAVSPSPQPGPQPAPPPAAPPADTPPPADTTPPPRPVITTGDRVTTKTPVIGGTAEPGATVQLAVDVERDGTDEAVFRTVADQAGQWRIDLASEPPASGALPGGLPDTGTARLTVTAIDAAWNQSLPATLELQVDVRGPVVPRITAVTDDVPAYTGTIGDGGLTNDPTPTVSGTLSAPLVAGESLQVLRNGSVIAADVSVDGTGWRFTDTHLGDGSYRYAVRVVGAEGIGPTSAGHAITVDTVNDKTATITAITDDVRPGTGTIRDGGTTNDASPTLTGRLSQALTAGETLQVLRDDVVLDRAPQVNGTRWTFTDGGLVNGDYDYQVRVVDAAGNLGRLSATYDIRVVLTASPRGVDPAADVIAFDAVLNGGESFGGEPLGGGEPPGGAASGIAWSPTRLPIDEPGA